MTYKTQNIFKMTNSEFTKYQKQQLNWQFKVDFLKEEIKKLGQEKKYPIFWIASFLLKTQVIEFEIKQLFSSLDLEIEVNLRKSGATLHRNIRNPEDFDGKMLGQTLNCFYEFDGIVTNDLKNNLKRLNTLRNDFTHRMFDLDKDIKQILSNAKKGVDLANKILDQITNLKQKIDEFWKEARKKIKNDKK
jgi:hypothetical protein